MKLLKLPRTFQKVNSLPEDPPGAVSYAHQDAGTLAIITMFPKPLGAAMPVDKPEEVVAGIHQALGDDQGLIEVACGACASGAPFIYSIVKSAFDMCAHYTLTMDVLRRKEAIGVQGFFDEQGTTGVRDSLVYATFAQSGGTMDQWMQDPYDPSFTRGVRMNRSEVRALDQQFPMHPLSECRQLVQEIVSRN